MAGSSHQPRQPALARFFLLFIMSLFVSQVFSDCYFPNGHPADGMSECRRDGKGTGMCCFNGDSCIDQICSHDTGHENKLYRGGCTSKTWFKDDICPDVCSGKDNSLDKYEAISPCRQKESYWCESYREEEGCDSKHRVVIKGPLDPFDIAEPISASKTSTSFSTTSTNSVTSGTSTETTTMRPTDGPPTDGPPTDGPPMPPTDTNISPSATSTDPRAPASTDFPGEMDDGHIIPVAVGIAVGTLITVSSSALLFFYIRKKRKERPRRAESPPPHHFTNF